MDTRQIALDLTAAVGAGDWAALEALCAEDMHSEFLGMMAFEGRKAFVQVSRIDQKKYTDFHAEVLEVLMHDETSVCFRGRVGGVQNGRIITANREYPPTGKPFAVEFLCWLQTTDGLITRVIYALDYLSVWTQLGHISPP